MSQYIESVPPLFFNVIGECSPLIDCEGDPRIGDPGLRHGIAGLRPSPEYIGAVAVDWISLIHRDHPHAVVFCRNAPAGFEQLFEVRASEVSELLPGVIQHLSVDAYQTLNGCGLARGYNARPNRLGIKRRSGASLAWGNRTKRNVSRLTAVWCDLDCYKVGIDPHTAIARARELVGRGELPMWSAELYSGRGAWLIWLLGEEGTQREAVRTRSGMESAGVPVVVHRDRVRVWEACVLQLHRRLSAVESDPTVKDPSRVARVAGSINSKSGEEVYFAVHRRMSDGLPACYSLREMAALLKVDLPEQRKRKPRGAVDPAVSERNRQNQLIGNRGRWGKLIRLAELRGGVREGEGGGNFMSIAAQLGRLVFDRDGNKAKRPELLSELRAFNTRHCRPPFSDAAVLSWHRHQCDRVMRGGDPIMNVIRDATIAEQLRITREEAELIGWRYAGQIDDPKPDSPRAIANHRREQIRQWVINDRGGEVPSAAETADWWERKSQLERPSNRTIQLDLKRLFGGARKDDRQVPDEPV